MKDIVERLQTESGINGDTDIRWHAADEIERLRAINAELVAALEALVERGTDSPEHRAAEAAIAKAKGETP